MHSEKPSDCISEKSFVAAQATSETHQDRTGDFEKSYSAVNSEFSEFEKVHQKNSSRSKRKSKGTELAKKNQHQAQEYEKHEDDTAR